MQNRNQKFRISPYLALCMLCLVPMMVSAKTIMILGDSLSAGYGIDAQQGWVHLLQQRLNQQYPKQHKVVNASVSGETTSGALARLPKLIQAHRPDVLVIELGGNDGLRGQPPKMIQQNLEKMIQQGQQNKAKVILLGMKIPPNYGSSYTQLFEQNYRVLSQKYKISFMPFFLKDVAGKKALMQSDGIHPNAKAQPILLNNVYTYIKGAL